MVKRKKKSRCPLLAQKAKALTTTTTTVARWLSNSEFGYSQINLSLTDFVEKNSINI